ncbi:MAG TPA: cold shock domain-containing protein [Bacteroidetes bacterium]|nr:cold shock domain-containing protein [Bacteroidota bacterium]
MAKSQETFGKKEKEKKRLKKRQDKMRKREDRKQNNLKGQGLDSMIAYVDENGNLSDSPPDPSKKKKIIASRIEIGVPKREEVSPIRTGRVEFFNHDKGYGFIKELESQEKFFVHINGCIEEIKENDLVTFELERGMKGMNAVRVEKVNFSKSPPK